MLRMATLVLLVETVLVAVGRVHENGERRCADRTGYPGHIVRVDWRRIVDRWRIASAHQNGRSVEVDRRLRVLCLVIRIVAVVIAIVLVVLRAGRR